MQIDCPDQAVAVWLRGDTLHVRYPDKTHFEMPACEIGRLLTIMRHRDMQANYKKPDLRLATPAAPVSLDVYDPATKDGVTARIKKEKAEADARKALMLRVQKRLELAEAEKTLEAAGL